MIGNSYIFEYKLPVLKFPILSVKKLTFGHFLSSSIFKGKLTCLTLSSLRWHIFSWIEVILLVQHRIQVVGFSTCNHSTLNPLKFSFARSGKANHVTSDLCRICWSKSVDLHKLIWSITESWRGFLGDLFQTSRLLNLTRFCICVVFSLYHNNDWVSITPTVSLIIVTYKTICMASPNVLFSLVHEMWFFLVKYGHLCYPVLRKTQCWLTDLVLAFGIVCNTWDWGRFLLQVPFRYDHIPLQNVYSWIRVPMTAPRYLTFKLQILSSEVQNNLRDIHRGRIVKVT